MAIHDNGTVAFEKRARAFSDAFSAWEAACLRMHHVVRMSDL
jgi:hypothetical protein